MSFLNTFLIRDRLVRPENTKLVTVTLGVAGGLWVAWGLIRRAIHTLHPAFLPGEPNPVLLATPFENITSSHEDDDELTNAEEYDVVIVGGGTAGCVLASRLSENPNLRVLLIEAGKSDLTLLHSRIPAAGTELIHSAVDYGLKTAPETNMHNREMSWPRGKLLGGCSSINALIYHRCSSSDYNAWRLQGWAWKDLEPYFRKAENFMPSSAWPVDRSCHGKGGPWQIRYPSFTSPLLPAFITGCNHIGVPTVPDINHGQTGMIGVTRLQTITDSEGRRSSAATAYLTEDVCRRKNLKISVGMTVTRIITQITADGKRVAKGVEFALGPHMPIRYRVKASRDVIISCGAVHTPHLLKVSGIGPKDELTRHGIKVIKDLPGVGANLQDHLLIPMTVNTAKGTSINYTIKPLFRLKFLAQWLLLGTGLLGANCVEGAVWMRSHDDPEAVDKIEDLTSAAREPDMEIISIPGWYKDMGKTKVPDLNVDQWTLGQIPLRPSSVGTITLADSNPFSPPIIHANYFSSESDRQISIWGFKKSCDIVKASGVFKSWEQPKRADELSDEEILEFLKESANTCYHPSGTAKIGAESNGGVVDTDLSVYGVQNLRVCDVSVMPRILSGHTCAPIIAMAEKFANMLKGEYDRVKA